MDIYLGGDSLAQSVGLKARRKSLAINVPISLRHRKLWDKKICTSPQISGDSALTSWMGVDGTYYFHACMLDPLRPKSANEPRL